MKLRCLIVDDEPIARKLLQEYIGDIDFLEASAIAENALKANNILDNEDIDLFFLDINMPKLTGLEFLKLKEYRPPVILTTAYAEYALEGYNLDVLDYLVKPFSFERFLKACLKARDYIVNKKSTAQEFSNTENYFFVKCDNRIEKIFYDELVAVEASLNYVTLHTNENKLIVYHTLKGIAEQLPEKDFLRVHKSFIVNLNKIKSIQGNEISAGKLKIAIGSNNYSNILNTILKDKMIKR